MEKISQHSEQPDSLQSDIAPSGETIDQPGSRGDFEWLLSEYASPRMCQIVTSWKETAEPIDASSMTCEVKHIAAFRCWSDQMAKSSRCYMI